MPCYSSIPYPSFLKKPGKKADYLHNQPLLNVHSAIRSPPYSLTQSTRTSLLSCDHLYATSP